LNEPDNDIDVLATLLSNNFKRLRVQEFYMLEMNDDTIKKVKWMLRWQITIIFNIFLMKLLIYLLPFCIFMGIQYEIDHLKSSVRGNLLPIVILSLLAICGQIGAIAIIGQIYFVEHPFNPKLSNFLLPILTGFGDILAGYLFIYKGLWGFTQLQYGFSFGVIAMCLYCMAWGWRLFKDAQMLKIIIKALNDGAIPALVEQYGILFPDTVHPEWRESFQNPETKDI